ncbi:DUF6263 family protein [Clostridium sp.]|jgi:hypothetical protein|uniref:DUF6263 family protein n=1 Tax=Clostridium sp. TaxID=1506 RepID=UPI0039F57A2D
MKKRMKILCVFFLSLSIIFSGCMQKSVGLLLHLKKGDSYKLETDRTEKVVYNVAGEKIETESKVKTSYLCHVTNVDDNKNAEIKVTFDSINIKNTMENGQTLINNSPTMAKDTDKLSKIYSTLIGKSFKVKIGEYGKVKQIIGMDELVKGVLDELNIKDENERKEIKEDMKQNFGDEELTKRIERISSFYPEKEVKMGDTWKQRVEVSDRFPVEAGSEYKLKDTADGTSEITVEGKIKSKENAEPIIINNIKITYEEITGEQKGNISVNEDTGLIKRAEMENKYSGRVKYASDDPNMGPQIYPITVEEKITVNVLRQ